MDDLGLAVLSAPDHFILLLYVSRSKSSLHNATS